MNYKILIVLLLLPFALPAVDCSNANIQPSTDESVDFEINNNGTVNDKSTGLMWMRCSAGQTWSDTSSSCSGTPMLLAWDKALLGAFKYSFAGFDDWRLPNINELRSILEDCRSSPAINQELFPNAPSAKFWSSSTYVGNATQAWIIDFGPGRDNFELKTKPNASRLVRVYN